MKKFSKSLTLDTPSKINWTEELEQTLAETGLHHSELAAKLGLYVQQRDGKESNVSPHFFRWLKGTATPKKYLLYALRYIRLIEGQNPPPVPKPTRKRKD